MNSVTIRNTQIKQNEEGLISLTDIWKASGGEKQKKFPARWLRNDEAVAFIKHVANYPDLEKTNEHQPGRLDRRPA
jgi:hypothetical protein